MLRLAAHHADPLLVGASALLLSSRTPSAYWQRLFAKHERPRQSLAFAVAPRAPASLPAGSRRVRIAIVGRFPD